MSELPRWMGSAIAAAAALLFAAEPLVRGAGG